MNAMDGLDKAYSDLQGVCDGVLAGLAGESALGAVAIPSESAKFARWHADMSEATKRFVAATGNYCKQEEGHTGLNNFIADKEMAQMCDYMVKHWDSNIVGAAKQVHNRELQLAATGRMRSMHDIASTLGFKSLKPLHTLSGVGLSAPLFGLEALKGAYAPELIRAYELDRSHPDSSITGVEGFPYLSDNQWCAVGMLCGIIDEHDGEYYEVMRYSDGVLMGIDAFRGVDGFWDRIKSGSKKIFGGIKRAANHVRRTFRKAGNAVKRVAKKAFNAVKRGVTHVVDKAKSTFHSVASVFSKEIRFVKDGVTYLWDKTKGLCKHVAGKLVVLAKNIADKLVTLAKKIKDIVKRFAKFINPKNIISRVVLLRNVSKGKHGLADSAYWAIAGQAEARRNGLSDSDYRAAKAAYDKMKTNLENWGGSVGALNAAIRSGRGKGSGRIPSKDEITRDLKVEASRMDSKSIVAEEQRKLYREHGVDTKADKGMIASAEKEAGINGVGIVITGTIGLITAIAGLIYAIVQLVLRLITHFREKRNRKEREKREKEQVKERARRDKAQHEAAMKTEKAKAAAFEAQAQVANSFPQGASALVAKGNPALRSGAAVASGALTPLNTAVSTARAKPSSLSKWLPIALAGGVGIVGLILLLRKRAVTDA